MLSAIGSALLPRKYDVFYREPASHETMDTLHPLPRWERVTSGSMQAIEHSRPGYSRSAHVYLTNEHIGVVGYVGDNLAAMGWIFINTTDREVRVKGYFPLPPFSAYLHADWTHPDWRGRGLHRASISHRIEIAAESRSCEHILTNIEPDNTASIRNYLGSGFRRTGELKVWPAWEMIRSRRLGNGDSA